MKTCARCKHFAKDQDGDLYCRYDGGWTDPVSGRRLPGKGSGVYTNDPLFYRSRWWLCGEFARWWKAKDETCLT